jgi:small subunit ribosomal protein S3
MGQKTHPIGFRLGQTAYWQNDVCPNSNAFSLDYSNVQDYVYNFMSSKSILLNKVHVVSNPVTQVHIDFFSVGSQLTEKELTQLKTVIKLYLNRPKLEFYFTDLSKLVPISQNVLNRSMVQKQRALEKSISVLMGLVPISNVISHKIAEDLESSVMHLRTIERYRTFINQAFDFWLTDGTQNKDNQKELQLKGCMVQVKGRINGSDRSRRMFLPFGQVSLTTVNTFIDYSYKTAITPYGALGVKVWLAYKKNI